MNKDRRNRLKKIQDELLLLVGEVGDIATEEQDALDNLPDSFRDGERGGLMQQAIDALEYVSSNIDDAISELDMAMEA